MVTTSMASSGLQQPQAFPQHRELCRSRRGKQLPPEQPHPQPPSLELAVQHALHTRPACPESPLRSFHEVSPPSLQATPSCRPHPRPAWHLWPQRAQVMGEPELVRSFVLKTKQNLKLKAGSRPVGTWHQAEHSRGLGEVKAGEARPLSREGSCWERTSPPWGDLYRTVLV